MLVKEGGVKVKVVARAFCVFLRRGISQPLRSGVGWCASAIVGVRFRFFAEKKRVGNTFATCMTAVEPMDAGFTVLCVE